MDKRVVAGEILSIAKELISEVSVLERGVVFSAIKDVQDVLSSLESLVDKMSTSKEIDQALQQKRRAGIQSVSQAIDSLKLAHKKLAGAFHLGYFSTKSGS
jgi:hypothetical protein